MADTVEKVAASYEPKREVWSSRLAFYFAAVGSAVGFGNVWRFPALSFSYGGGAFFIPYLMALFLIGIPILILEIGFGQFFQTGDVGVFGSFHPRFRGVGVSSVACGFMLVTYYAMLIAWVVNAFFDSFKPGAPWTKENVDGGEAVMYFILDIIGAKTVGDDGRPTRLVPANVGYSCLVWAIVFLCIAFGIQWTGRVTYFTMGLPVILLFVFLGRAVSLPGSSEGIHEYIGIWDVSVLSEQGDVWSTAVSQIFFSIGVTFGIMTAYGSYCKRDEPAALNSLVIAISNSLFSFISGFAVFAAVGHLAHKNAVEVKDISFAGFSLVFGTWPVILGTLPGGIHWVRLLFFDLFLLGLDSAFSFAEGVVTVVQDTVMFQHTAKWKITGVFCLVSWLIGLIYATDAGLSWLDLIDFYINFVMLAVGFLETFAAGWGYKIQDMVDELGMPAVVSYMCANFVSVLVASGIWFFIPVANGAIWAGFVALIGIFVVFFAISCFFLSKKMQEEPDKWTWGSILWALTFKNIFDLRDRIQPVIRWIPGIWCILIKQFIPHVLIILFINLARTKTDEGKPIFSGYGGYSMLPYQALGISTFAFAAFLFVIGILFPAVYYPLALPPGHPALEDEEGVEKKVDSSEDVDAPVEGEAVEEDVVEIKKEPTGKLVYPVSEELEQHMDA